MTDSKSDIIHLPQRPETVHAIASHSKYRMDFDYSRQESIEACVQTMIHEARTRIMRPMRPVPPLEIIEKLPEIWK